jgi:hypothetical protein
LAAGIALLPITALLLLLSARAGALAQRMGPRIPMTLGPVICAGALVLFARIGANTSGSLTNPAALAPAYRTAMLLCSGLLLVGAAIAFTAIPAKLANPDQPQPPARPVRFNCAITGPPLQPRTQAAARSPRSADIPSQ